MASTYDIFSSRNASCQSAHKLKENLKTYSAVFMLALTGCAANTGVISIGNETFSVSHRDNGPMSSLGALKAAAYQDATAFCATKKKTMQVVKSNDIPRSFGQFPETEVQFQCIN